MNNQRTLTPFDYVDRSKVSENDKKIDILNNYIIARTILRDSRQERLSACTTTELRISLIALIERDTDLLNEYTSTIHAIKIDQYIDLILSEMSCL